LPQGQLAEGEHVSRSKLHIRLAGVELNDVKVRPIIVIDRKADLVQPNYLDHMLNDW
jgi:hypothetical protein